MLKVTAAEYNRRGRPLEHTRWSPEDVHRYMRAYLRTKQPNDDMGAYGHLLPKALENGTPSALPEFVLEFEKAMSSGLTRQMKPSTGPESAAKVSESKPSQDELVGYEVVGMQLRHVASGLEVKLKDIGHVYDMYNSDGGDVVYAGEASGYGPEVCWQLFREMYGTCWSDNKKAQSAGTTMLPGMKLKNVTSGKGKVFENTFIFSC